MRRFTLGSFISCSLIASTALAQSNPAKDSHLDAATASPADKPITVADTPGAADSDIARILSLLTGSFAAAQAGDQPGLTAHAAPIHIEGIDNTVLLEIGRADSPASPFRLAVLHAYRRQGALRLRVFDLTGNPGLKDALVGLWAAPAALPKLSTASLTPNVDMPLRAEGTGFTGTTTQPFPTLRDGAIEMTSSIRFDNDGLSITDAGFDANGKRVWGNDADHPVVFARVTPAAASPARTLDGGLTIITLVPPAPGAPVLADNGELTAHYTGWLTDGTRFDTSRQQGREPFKIRIPGPVIKGWNEGLKGIAKGERRRIIIPPELGYGDRGAGRGLIPANSTLIFDVEALYIDNTQTTPPPAVPTPAPAHGGADASPKPADTPLGKPPTNSVPEKPR